MEKTSAIGKVVRIISDKRLIIDVGEDELTIGDKVVIFTESDEITDTEGNSLGRYEYVKDTLDVIETSDMYSVCAKLEVVETSSLGVVATMFNKTRTIEANLKVNEKDIKPLANESDPTIRVGDLVRMR
ncbi:MAG: hypothetical protein IJ225_08430 [Solobacterium sp.]|nr:hypothetical protein [Solobacterium sp.]